MNWLVYHIVSGQSYFSGAILLVIAASMSLRSGPAVTRISMILAIFGSIAVAVSATPVPYWVYAAVVFVTLAWLISSWKPSMRKWTAWGMVFAWSLALGIELPSLTVPPLRPANDRSMAIIGDSVTAGVDGDETSKRWPVLLAKQHHIEVQDISHIGETAASATKRVQATSIHAPVVVVEIGGNDLLGDTTPQQFAQDLDALLSSIVAPGRQVMMFELPLPPFCNEYGRIQRNLARKHDVTLAPKRFFLSVIAGSDSTLDSIHLSQPGHEKMAEVVWSLIQNAFPDE